MTLLTERAMMNELERFEMQAKTFYRVTGYLRPGKDQPAEMTHPSREERMEAWFSYMRMRKAHNFLRVLMSLDYDEVATAMTKDEWPTFRDDPHRWFIRADDRQQWEVWQVAEKRAAP